jgi:hypothetical protein
LFALGKERREEDWDHLSISRVVVVVTNEKNNEPAYGAAALLRRWRVCLFTN